MIVLGIESSCDETGVAIVKTQCASTSSEVVQNTSWATPGFSFLDTHFSLIGQALHSQINLHQAYGGVVPELASRDHIRRVLPLLEQALTDAQCSIESIDAIAYTKGPGLAGALLVGAGVACSLGMALNKPMIPIHHLEGHLLSPFLSDRPPKFPFVILLVSGGHTQLMQVQGIGRYTLLGESVDDAAGEAFDKSAKLLGLPYPGGALLEHLATQGHPSAFNFPRPLLHSADLNFSFAGLKTAVAIQCNKNAPLTSQVRADIAASAQAAIVDVLVKKSLKALALTGLNRLVIAGGVGANTLLRHQIEKQAKIQNFSVHYPPLSLCTDNGAMIALAGAMRLSAGAQKATFDYAFNVLPRWNLETVSTDPLSCC